MHLKVIEWTCGWPTEPQKCHKVFSLRAYMGKNRFIPHVWSIFWGLKWGQSQGIHSWRLANTLNSLMYPVGSLKEPKNVIKFLYLAHFGLKNSQIPHGISIFWGPIWDHSQSLHSERLANTFNS